MEKKMLEEIVSRTNMTTAYERVVSNKGVAGVDKMSVDGLLVHMQRNWATIKQQILAGTYIPQAVRKVEIPKANGGKRMLGIPTVTDRMIQQAIAQKLSEKYDAGFSESSFGFRPKCSAHQAVRQSRSFLNKGYTSIVEMDMEKFFDKVHHDKLMGILSERIADKALLKLIRRYLKSGIMEGGVTSVRSEGTPQGSPLSPILSNILLDKLDKELESRGHRFVRYADDVSIYVRSKRAAERTLQSVTSYLEGVLLLKVNKEKSKVSRPMKSNLLGFTFGKVKGFWEPLLSTKTKDRIKEKIKTITSRKVSISLEDRLRKLAQVSIGWCSYFAISKSKTFMTRLDEWTRFRIRMCIWKAWKQPRTRIRELIRLGMDKFHAYLNGNTRKSYCRTAHSGILHHTLTNDCLVKMGFQPVLAFYESRQV